jgi:hypothetical protein
MPSDIGKSVAFIEYLQTMNVKHLAIINVNDSYGNQIADAIRQMVTEITNDEIQLQQIPIDEEYESIPQVVEALKKTQYRYIYCIVHNQENHDALLLEAVQQGVAGDGLHNWFFDDAFTDVLLGRQFKKGSELARAYQGAGQLSVSAFVPGSGYPPSDAFMAKVAQLKTPENIEYLNSLFPHERHEGIEFYESGIQPVKTGEFIDRMASLEEQSRAEAWYYDGVIALGLAACDAFLKKGVNFTGQDHFESLVGNIFEGVTGTIKLDAVTGTRTAATSEYAATNRVVREVNETHIEFETVTTDRFEKSVWVKYSDFIFNGGGTDIPLDIPPVSTETNDVLPAVQGTVLGLCCVSILLAIAFSMWTQRNRNAHVVRASQPFFLHTISFGVIILVSSIIPLSMESTVACNATIWLICMGWCVTFAALFTKNYRINKILVTSSKMKRVSVSVKDVAIPMVSLLSSKC